MFLLDHWLSTDPPGPSVTAEANDYDVLFDRVIRCGRERDLVPNLIAIDFYSEGDLLAVVDTLNGVRSDADGDTTSDSD